MRSGLLSDPLLRLRRAVAALACLGALSSPLAAGEARLQVVGDRLIYDTQVEVEGELREIEDNDVELIRDLLRDNPGIRVLELNSTGGGYFAALDIATLAIDFALDTHVVDICESACVTIFLGGAQRTMAKGAKLGFHQLTWDSEAAQGFYEENRERRDWSTPFEFVEWVYEDTQTETYNRLTYMVGRGVDATFAIQTIRRPDTGMWYPYRPLLLAAGVLTE